MRRNGNIVPIIAAFGLLGIACSSSDSRERERSGRSPADSVRSAPPALDAAAAGALAEPAKPPKPAEPEAKVTSSDPAPAPKPAPRPTPAPALEIDPAVDFIAEARTFHRIAACAGDAPLPKQLTEKFVAELCKVTSAAITTYRGKYIDKVVAFFKDKVPADLPKKVVYPFAGADLVTALSVFRDASEITTLSLEPSGDPRMLEAMPRKRAEKLLREVRHFMVRLMRSTHNRTVDLSKVMTWGKLPGHLMFTLIGMRAHGYEPVSMRYFEVKDDGTLEYKRRDELAKAVIEQKSRRQRGGPSHRRLPNRVKPFANVEIRFRLAGNPTAPIRTYRHIQGDLSDKALAKNGGVLVHLEAKGKIAAMTKAGSYLLWLSNFAKMRKYLLDNMQWMVSDATGIPPRYSRKAGFEVKAWGSWKRQIKDAMPLPDYLLNDMRKLWRNRPKLEFRFGYPGGGWADHHLMITQRKKAS